MYVRRPERRYSKRNGFPAQFFAARFPMAKPSRLYIDAALEPGGRVAASDDHAHYLLNVMRRTAGAEVLLFNGRDGEWLATVAVPGKRRVEFDLKRQTRAQEGLVDLWLAFAPVKRIEFLAEKGAELGVSQLRPVFTRHTDVTRVNVGRLKANVIEACEQCERLSVPDVHDPVTLDQLIAAWPKERTLFMLDETGGGKPIADVLGDWKRPPGPAGFLTGPEGGFAQSELDGLRQLPFVTPVGLGPRVLRAETAAIAAVACWQALLGDWAPR